MGRSCWNASQKQTNCESFYYIKILENLKNFRNTQLENGVSAIFGPGSKISETAIEILNLLIKQP